MSGRIQRFPVNERWPEAVGTVEDTDAGYHVFLFPIVSLFSCQPGIDKKPVLTGKSPFRISIEHYALTTVLAFEARRMVQRTEPAIVSAVITAPAPLGASGFAAPCTDCGYSIT